jgi:hypothetical protein
VNTGAAFSISFWMKIDSYPGGYPYIFTLKSDQSEAFIIGASDQTNYAGLFLGYQLILISPLTAQPYLMIYYQGGDIFV